jgi:hypothetical protein
MVNVNLFQFGVRAKKLYEIYVGKLCGSSDKQIGIFRWPTSTKPGVVVNL